MDVLVGRQRAQIKFLMVGTAVEMKEVLQDLYQESGTKRMESHVRKGCAGRSSTCWLLFVVVVGDDHTRSVNSNQDY
jgi:hypothetical protein